VSSKRKQFKIYGPHHFTATWKKYLEICERDGRSASGEIRVFVEGQVRGRDPGNPQRPITAYAPGHRDQLVLVHQEAFKKLEVLARDNRLEVGWYDIIDELKASFKGQPLADAAREMGRRLTKAGLKVLR